MDDFRDCRLAAGEHLDSRLTILEDAPTEPSSSLPHGPFLYVSHFPFPSSQRAGCPYRPWGVHLYLCRWSQAGGDGRGRHRRSSPRSQRQYLITSFIQTESGLPLPNLSEPTLERW